MGHVHAREVLSERPWVVYPGNLQGHNVRETGFKGATLIEVADGTVCNVQHRPLDLVRWAVEEVDVAGASDRDAVLACVRQALERTHAAADGRALAVRVRLVGRTARHAEITADAAHLREEIETVAAGLSADVWIERLELRTASPVPRDGPDPTVAGRMRSAVEALAASDWLTQRLEAKLAEIAARMPDGARRDALMQALRQDAKARARDLALALIERGAD